MYVSVDRKQSMSIFRKKSEKVEVVRSGNFFRY